MNNTDTRIVEMQFNNRRFEENAKETMSTLDKLKEKLSFKSATREMEDFQNAADSFNLSRIAEAVEGIGNKFTLMGNLGQEAMKRIANAALDAGTQLVKSISVDQISAGMSKYEQETNIIQTMYGALKPKGVELNEIYSVMEDLTSYSDETSYSYTQMADAISKFVNAGVELHQAETVIEGISNAAAKAGIGIHETAIIYRNFSDAIAKGGFRLQDWNSISIAHMDTEWLKDAFIEEAINLGKLDKSGRVLVKAEKRNAKGIVTAAAEYKNVRENFKDTLSKGWLDNEVITAVMLKYANRGLEGFGKEAFAAAQNAKTFTDVLDAVKDAASTGWSRSFRIIFGDLNEAIALFTPMANKIIEVVNAIDEARNEMLGRWKEFGGRDSLINAVSTLWNMMTGFGETLTNVFKGVFSVTKFIKQNLGGIYSEGREAGSYWETIGDILQIVTKNLEEGAKAFKDWFTPKRMNMIYYGLNGVLSILRGVILAVKGAFQFFGNIFEQLKPAFDPLLDLFAAIGADIGYAVYQADSANNIFTTLAKKLANIFTPITSRLPKVIEWVGSLYLRIRKFWNENERFVAIRKTIVGVFNAFIDYIPRAIESFIRFGKSLIDTVRNSKEWKVITENYNKYIKPLIQTIADGAIKLGQAWIDFFNVDTSNESSPWEAIKKRFSVFGQLIPWVTSTWEKAKQKLPWLQSVQDWWNASPFISELKQWVSKITSAISTFLGTNTSGESGLIGKIKKRFSETWGQIGPWITEKIAEYKERFPILKTISSFFTDIFGNAKTAFNGVGGFNGIVKFAKDAFTNIKDFFKNINLDGIATFIRGFISKIGELFGPLAKGVQDSVKTVGGFAEYLKPLVDIVSWGINLVTRILGDLFGYLKTFVDTHSTMDILKLIGKVLLILRSYKALKSIKKTFEFTSNLSEMFGSIGDYFDGLKKKLKSSTIKNMALLVASVCAFILIAVNSIKQIAAMKPGEAAVGIGGVVVLLIGLGLLMKAADNMEVNKGTASTLLAAGIVLKILTKTVFSMAKQLEGVNIIALIGAVGLLAVCIYGVRRLLKTVDGIKVDKGAALALIGAVASLKILVNAVFSAAKQLENTNLLALGGSLLLLAGCIYGLKQLMKVMDGADVKVPAIFAMVVSVLALKLLIGTLFDVAKQLEKANILALGGAIVLVGACIFGIIKLTDSIKDTKDISFKSFLPIIAAVAALEIVMLTFSALIDKTKDIDTAKLITLGASIVLMGVVITAITVLAGKVGGVDLGALAKFSIGMVIVAAALAAAIGILATILGQSLESFSNNIAMIGSNMAQYSDMVKDVDFDLVERSLTALKDVAETFVAIGAKNYGDLETFKTNLSRMSSAFKIYYLNIAPIDLEHTKSATEVIQYISVVFAEIGGKEYGNLELFKSNMTRMGSSLKIFALNTAAVSIEMVTAIIGLLKDISNAFVEIGGKEYGNIETFRTTMSRMSSSAKIFNTNAAEFDLEKMKATTEALKTMATDLAGFPEVGDVSTSIGNIGGAIKLYASSLEGADLSKVPDTTAIKTVFNTLKDALPKDENLTDVASYASEDKGAQLTNFAIGLTNIATAVSDFAKSTEGMNFDQIDKAIEALNALDKLNTQTTITTISSMGDFTVETTTQVEKGNFDTFAADIVSMGVAVADFGNSVADTDFSQVDKAVAALAALNTLNTGVTTTTVAQLGDFSVTVTDQVSKGNFDTFAEDIVSMGVAVADFGNNVKDTDFSQVDKAVAALVALNTLNTELGKTTIVKFGPFALELSQQTANMTNFSTDIISLGTALKDFGSNVGTVDTEQMGKSVDVLKKIVDVNNALPPTGGISQWINGTKTLSGFAAGLRLLGNGAKEFSLSIKDGNFDTDEVKNAGDVLIKIAEVNNKLPPTGGISSWFTGDESLGGFGNNLRTLGEGIAGFTEALGNTKVTDDIDDAVAMLSRIASIQIRLSGKESWYSMTSLGSELKDASNYISAANENIAGKTWASESEMKSFEDLLTFAETQTGNLQGTGWENMSTAAMYLNDAADYIVETNGKLIAVENWADTTSFINLLNQAVDMQIRLGDTKYTKNLKDLGTNIKDFYNEVDSISAVFLGRDNNKLDQITNSITSIFGTLNEMYSNLDANGEFTISGENIINSILGGMKSDNSTKSIVSAGNQLSMRVINTVRQNDQNFRNVGTWIPAGLARGIEQNSAAVINKVQSMMQATLDIAMETIDAHSPSKEFYKIGNYAVMGVEEGISNNAGSAANATWGMMDGILEIGNTFGNMFENNIKKRVQSVKDTVVKGVTDASDQLSNVGTGLLDNVLGDFASSMGLDFDGSKYETELVITPVWDGQGFRVIGDELEAVKEGTKSVSIDTGVKIDTGKVESKWSSVSALQDIAANRKQDQMLYDINKRIDKLQGTIEHTQVVLDTGVLVGEMTSDIDKSLGNKSTLSGRGN